MPRELDDETVNYHNPQSLSVLSRKLFYAFIGQPFSKQLYTLKQIMTSLWPQTEESRYVLDKGMLRMLVNSTSVPSL